MVLVVLLLAGGKINNSVTAATIGADAKNYSPVATLNSTEALVVYLERQCICRTSFVV
jgi:hypothetical protein